MSLKSYTGHSDRKLIERPNSDHHVQPFCGFYLRPGQHPRDHEIGSHIRCELARPLDIEDLQKHLMEHCKPYMDPLDISPTDATCYGTAMRYPTRVKLLWESCEGPHRQMGRATRVEGSFGTERQHYPLDRTKARTEQTDTLWICFGVHTDNAVRVAKRVRVAKGPPPKIRPVAWSFRKDRDVHHAPGGAMPKNEKKAVLWSKKNTGSLDKQKPQVELSGSRSLH